MDTQGNIGVPSIGFVYITYTLVLIIRSKLNLHVLHHSDPDNRPTMKDIGKSEICVLHSTLQLINEQEGNVASGVRMREDYV